MADNKLPDEILDALVENTKVIDANNAVLESLEQKKEKTETKEANVIKIEEASSSLTSSEKTRYANIGNELFKPVLSALEKLLKKEKKNDKMLIKNESETVENAVHVQYTEKPQKTENEKSWISTLFDILTVAAIAVALFKDKIVSFFKGAWDWIKNIFSSIGNFFSFSNKNSPISKILSTIGGALSGLWSFVTKVFSGIGNFGSIIWNGIKSGWETFITGENGIIHFGSKIISSIVDFASNGVKWLGSAIKNAIMWPINKIFGKAEEDGKEAADEAAAEVKVQVDKAASAEAAKKKAITDDVILSADRANKSIAESADKQRKAAEAQAKKFGLTTKDGKISDQSIKLKAAEDTLKTFLKSKGADYDNLKDEQKKELKEIMAKHTKISEDGTAEVDMASLKEALNEAKSDGIFVDSDEINALQEASQAEINTMQNSLKSSLTTYMKLNADMEAADKLKNMTEEEKFEARLQQAMASGKSAEFRFVEGRKMITESVETLKRTFNGYDEQIRKNFVETWTGFVSNFFDKIKIYIQTSSPCDYSRNTYHIMPVHKESLVSMSNNLLKLTTKQVEIAVKQNKILSDIKVLLEVPIEKDSDKSPIIPIGMPNPENNGTSYMAQTGKNVINDLWASVTSWG